MLCDQCQEREAVVHLTQIAQDAVVTHHLCERCASEKGIESDSSLGKTPVGTMLASMGKSLDAGAALSGSVPTGPCPSCGATLSDFRESGRLGCAECYRAFEEPLRDVLRRVHGASRHIGERYSPKGAPVPEGPAETVLQLREQLKVAIAAEQFERAAELRDRLRAQGGEG
jgi:protein arginine kinase activator